MTGVAPTVGGPGLARNLKSLGKPFKVIKGVNYYKNEAGELKTAQEMTEAFRRAKEIEYDQAYKAYVRGIEQRNIELQRQDNPLRPMSFKFWKEATIDGKRPSTWIPDKKPAGGQQLTIKKRTLFNWLPRK